MVEPTLYLIPFAPQGDFMLYLKNEQSYGGGNDQQSCFPRSKEQLCTEAPPTYLAPFTPYTPSRKGAMLVWEHPKAILFCLV